MNKKLGLILALWATGLALTGVVFAASDEATERRVDSETYQILGTTTPGSGPAVEASPAQPDEARRVSTPAGPLAELEARQSAEYATLLAAAMAASPAEREAREREIAALKSRHTQERLQLVRAQAEAAGDAAYLARVAEAQRGLDIRPLPAGTPVLRDPASGIALSVPEGTSK